MKILFLPDHEDIKLVKLADDCNKLWKKEGDKITQSIEKLCTLKFKEKKINAILFDHDAICQAFPLGLKSDHPEDRLKSILIHELVHRIVAHSSLRIKSHTHSEKIQKLHKLIYLILFDVWEELYALSLFFLVSRLDDLFILFVHKPFLPTLFTLFGQVANPVSDNQV